MKKQLLLLISILPLILLAQADLKVISADEARSLRISEKHINANGKVLITKDYYKSLKRSSQTMDDPDEIEGYPILGLDGTTGRASRFVDIDLDGEKEVIFLTGNAVRVYTPTGEVKTGWPAFVGSDPIEGAPSVGNIDADPELEVVVHTTFYSIHGGLYAFDHDGSLKSGFPIEWPDGGPQKEPLLENVDNDPELEIISHIYNYPTSLIFAYNGDGTLNQDWDGIELDYIPGSGCSSGDITGDGIPEIIACSYWKLYAYNNKADLLEGFPYTFEQDVRGVSYSNPVIADIDNDGIKEIAVATCNEQPVTDAGAVYVIKNDGSLMPGWPQYTLRWIYACLSVVDFDQDGNLDILAGDQVLSPYPDDYLHAWDKDGNNLPGFPVGSLEAINIQGMVGDFDGFPDLEIIVDNNVTGGPYQIFEHDGSEFTFFSLNPQGATFFNTALLADINSDGNLNILAPTVNFDDFTTDMHIYDIEIPIDQDLLPLWTHQYNSRNTGEYGLFDPVTGIQPLNMEQDAIIMVFPNPFNSQITIDVPKVYINFDMEFQLFNATGKLVFSRSLNLSKEMKIDFPAELPAGIYYYTLTGNESSESGKLIKQ